ncbi:MoxR-like ATPase [Candidatus Frackibacter sp. WG11]|uniref:AAA family ATPase n=1 Tax=Candidatus Frackibacter sp. WG11 TaxID=2017976 RepID=UPI0008872AE2|nr:MoxR family ATPase [Candidatus Frackibacter sp. WG11]SDC54257.1 MoxR-like ATPase [Candidatus Frackibacter sp. WG11]
MEITKEKLEAAFKEEDYICGEEIIIPTYLALNLEKPLLITGEPGVGKTEIAKVLSKVFDTELIRLQCYEGLDENKALYEWNYQKQLISIQINKDNKSEDMIEENIFSEDYLLQRPLLKAIKRGKRPVLLIDEIDKTDEEFEAFLFELLSDFQVSIPELGTVKANKRPIVVLTSNANRELSDGLKRRCVFLYIDLPSVEKEVEIIRTKVTNIGEELSKQIAAAISYLRTNLELKKLPSISETLDWARALAGLDADRLSPELIHRTRTLFLKTKDDLDNFEELGAKKLSQEALKSD